VAESEFFNKVGGVTIWSEGPRVPATGVEKGSKKGGGKLYVEERRGRFHWPRSKRKGKKSTRPEEQLFVIETPKKRGVA